MNYRRRLTKLETRVAARRDDGIPLEELTPYERCRVAIYCYRALWPEATRPPDAPTESYLREVERVLSTGGPDVEEVGRRCWQECWRWLERGNLANNERDSDA
jgi:hypothetical protein